MSYNHYKEVEKIIALLKKHNHSDFAKLLQSSIEEGATGNEIFMALRYNLDIIIDKPDLESYIKTDCIKLRKEIHNTLESL